MKRNKKYYIVLLLLILLVNGKWMPVSAQGDDIAIEKKDFDKKEWEELIKDLDYSVDKVVESKPRKREPVKISNVETWRTILKTLGFILFIGLVVTILYHLLDGDTLFRRSDKKISSKISPIALQELEDNLPDSDIDGLIQEAIRTGEYTLAIRLSYLAIIKELSVAKKIKWKKDKTNRQYLRELRNTKYEANFKELTYIFERIWYGDKSLTKTAFRPIYEKYSLFINAIKSL